MNADGAASCIKVCLECEKLDNNKSSPVGIESANDNGNKTFAVPSWQDNEQRNRRGNRAKNSVLLMIRSPRGLRVPNSTLETLQGIGFCEVGS
jgi:hypothetical protein